MKNLLVGAGKACITPPQELLPFPTSIGASPREAIHDDIFVRAVVIDNGQTRAAVVTFDLCILPPPDEARAIIAEAGQIPPENIVMCATHNHSVPYTRRANPGLAKGGPDQGSDAELRMEAFTEIVFAGARSAAETAVQRMRPAKYGYGTGESYINVNRDKQFEDGNWMQNPNPAGYSDKTLAVIKFVDEEERLIAAVLNYAAHGIFGFIAPDFDGKIKVSSDFIGVTCSFVERRFGDDAVVLWTPAAEGNQNPLFTSMVCVYEDDGYAVRKDLPDGSAYMLMESAGGEHAIDAIRVINSITSYENTMPIKAAHTMVELPGQKPPAGADMQLNRLLVDNLVPLNPDGSRPPKNLVRMEEDPEHPYPMPMQLLTLGDIAIVGVPNEIYSEIGRDMKLASPCRNTIVMTHTDSRYIGYIADKASGDHNVFQSFGPVKPGACDDIIIGGMLDLFKMTDEG